MLSTSGIPSSPLSSSLGNTTPPLIMETSATWASDDDLSPHYDDGCPPHGCGTNSFLPCTHYRKLNHLAKKFWKQFSKHPIAQAVVTHPAPLSLGLPRILTPQYYVILTSAEYGMLCHFKSTEGSPSASLALLQLPPHQIHS